jgi:hypothetical protein
MHPVIIRQLVADHLREIYAKAEDEHRARRAAGQRPTWPEQLSAPSPLVMAGSRQDSGDASTERKVLEHGH